MAGQPLIVSLWRRKDKEGFLCSGLLLTERHILTVGHAFDVRTEKDPVYVRLIDGVDGDVIAKVLQRHQVYDAAVLELETAVGAASRPDLAANGRGSFGFGPGSRAASDRLQQYSAVRLRRRRWAGSRRPTKPW